MEIILMTIIMMPLLNAICTALFGWSIGIYGTMRIMIVHIGWTTVWLFFCIFWSLSSKEIVYIDICNWILLEDLNISFSFVFDPLAMTMFFVILTVAYVVHIASCSYMRNDPHFVRFMSYLSLFSFFMLVLVSADNMVLMFLGWEGVGICSYLLIGFWNTRIETTKSSLKAIIVNRVGDVALLLAFSLIFFSCRSLDFSIVNCLAPYMGDQYINIFSYRVNLLNLICLLLFIGIIGKSAQIGLHIWLPDAMEGPTPVSALIHAATMVTAGIFLALRMSHIIEYCELVLMLMVFFGGLTALIASLTAFMQDDIKKIIAYSTCSQLGYMMIMCGLSKYNIALFHLLNHAFFKALLFLAAGAIIHLYGNQDIRKVYGIKTVSPFLSLALVVGALSIEGFMFFSSVESKDLYLEIATHKFLISNHSIMWFSILCLFTTCLYTSTLVDICSGVIDRDYRLFKNLKLRLIDNEMFLSLLILMLFTILSNFMFADMFINSDYFDESLFIHPKHSSLFDYDILKYYFRIWLIIGFGVGVPTLSFSEGQLEQTSFKYMEGKYATLIDLLYLIRVLGLYSILIGIVWLVYWHEVTSEVEYWFGTVIGKHKLIRVFRHVWKNVPMHNLFYNGFGFLEMIVPFIILLGFFGLLICWVYSTYADEKTNKFFFQRINNDIKRLNEYVTHKMKLEKNEKAGIPNSFVDKHFSFYQADYEMCQWVVLPTMLPFFLIVKYSRPIVLAIKRLYSSEIWFTFDRAAYEMVVLFHNKFYFDTIWNEMVASRILDWSVDLFLYVDKLFLEVFGPDGITAVMFKFLKNYKQITGGFLYNYLFLFIYISSFILLAWFLCY